MLVLSRKANESIEIGDNITITVVSIRGDKIRLGFEAPKEVKIVRSELIGKEKVSEDDTQFLIGDDNTVFV